MQVLSTDAGSVNSVSMPSSTVSNSKASIRKKLFTAAINDMSALWAERNLGAKRPSVAFWRHGCVLPLTTANVLYHFQLQFQQGNIMDDAGKRWVVKPAAYWQGGSGLTENEWNPALEKGVDFIRSEVRIFDGIKQVWLRPTEGFMGVFGLTLDDYDTVGRLEKRRRQVGRPLKGMVAPKDGAWTDAEHAAFKRWCAAGGHSPIKNVL